MAGNPDAPVNADWDRWFLRQLRTLDLDPIVVLLETADARREFDLDVRQHLQPT